MQTTGDVTTQLMDAHETSRHYQRGRDGGWWGGGVVVVKTQVECYGLQYPICMQTRGVVDRG